MAQAKARIEQVAGDNAKKIRFGNGESGWPTGMLPPSVLSSLASRLDLVLIIL